MNFQSSSRIKKILLQNQRGQGLIEYLIIVALMAVATIGITRVMGQTVTAKFAEITHALQGRKQSVKVERIEESLHKKKDLSNFFDGVGDRNAKDGK